MAPAATQTDRLTLARGYFRARRYPEAARAYRDVHGAPEEAKGAAKDLFDYALALSRSDDYDAAATVYRRLMATHPNDELADTASFKLGYLEYDRGNCDLAVERFDAHVARVTSSRNLDSALWFIARCAWRADDVEGASATWRELIEKRPRSSLVPGADYWLARASGALGQPERERAELRRVLSKWPDTAYAFYASERLRHVIPEKPVAGRAAWPASIARNKSVRRSEALLATGFHDWAAAELRAARAEIRAGGAGATLAASHALLAAGDAKTARELMDSYCGRGRAEERQIAAVCHPLPQRDLVEVFARRFELDPLLPFAVMEAESALDPSVTSSAGARGLMQIMPDEGPRLHRVVFGDGRFDPDDLYASRYNAALGTTELGTKNRTLGDALDGTSLPAVIASYNAGEDAVKRWLSSPDVDKAFDEFAEDISYSETRRYVRNVLGHLMALRRVHGQPGK